MATSAVGHISKQEQPKLTPLCCHWSQLSIKSQNSVPSVRALGAGLGAQLLVIKPALIWCCCAAWKQTAMRKALWENAVRRILLLSASFKFRPYPCLHYVAEMPVSVYVLCWFRSCSWPTGLISCLHPQICLIVLDFSGHLAFWLTEFGVARLAQWVVLRVCGTALLGEGTVLHTLGHPWLIYSQRAAHSFLLPDPGSCYKVFWCIFCGLTVLKCNLYISSQYLCS